MFGIIPAHAGLTKWRWWRWVPKWDHPRACGAHGYLKHARFSKAGSSPRMRGSLYVGAYVGEEPGIIPAHAGLTCSIKR